MKNRLKLSFVLSLICLLSLVFCFSFNAVSAQETAPTNWIVNSSAPDLTVSNVEEGGVGKITYYTVPSNSLLNAVTIPVKNYDIVDDYLSIKYQADFPVSGTNITIYLNYMAGADTTTGEDYPAGDVLVGWFENWNVESGKTRDGFDFITVNTGTYTTDKTVCGITLSFSYAGSSSTAKNIEILGIDFHKSGKTPVFVTDSDPVEGSIVLGEWVPDSEAGNIEYNTDLNGYTTIHYSSAPTGKSRIVAPITGHEVDLLPKLKVTYSCTKNFNLAVYINGTSKSLQSYTNITDNNGSIVFDLTETMTKLCIIVDRKEYHESSTYTSEDPTKTIYLQFAFIDASGKEITVVSVANNNNTNGGGSTGGGTTGGGESTGGGSSDNNPSTSGGVTIGAWQDDSAGNMQISKDTDGKTVVYFPAEPTSKSRYYASVEGHDLSLLPKLKVTYSCTKEFNFALYINGTSKSLLSYQDITDNEGELVFDLSETVTSIYMMVDRNGHHNPDTYSTEDPTKTVVLTFTFVDANGNEGTAGGGNTESGGNTGSEEVTGTVIGNSGAIDIGNGMSITYSTSHEKYFNVLEKTSEAPYQMRMARSATSAYAKVTVTVSGWTEIYDTLVVDFSVASGKTLVGIMVGTSEYLYTHWNANNMMDVGTYQLTFKDFASVDPSWDKSTFTLYINPPSVAVEGYNYASDFKIGMSFTQSAPLLEREISFEQSSYTFDYDGTAKSVQATTDAEEVVYTYVLVGGTGEPLSEAINAGVYTVTATAPKTATHYSATATTTITINQIASTLPEIQHTVSGNLVSFNPTEGIEYRFSDGDEWQDLADLTLEYDTEYSIEVRVKESENYLASESEIISFTTQKNTAENPANSEESSNSSINSANTSSSSQPQNASSSSTGGSSTGSSSNSENGCNSSVSASAISLILLVGATYAVSRKKRR